MTSAPYPAAGSGAPAVDSTLMNRTMFKSKIHRATVTSANLHYVGSVTVDLDLLEAADILPGCTSMGRTGSSASARTRPKP